MVKPMKNKGERTCEWELVIGAVKTKDVLCNVPLEYGVRKAIQLPIPITEFKIMPVKTKGTKAIVILLDFKPKGRRGR